MHMQLRQLQQLRTDIPRLVKRFLIIRRPRRIKRSSATYLTEQGWQRTNDGLEGTWEGFYRTRYGSLGLR